MSKFGVLIVDDESLARDTIRLLLEGDDEVEVLAECVDGAEAIDAIRRLAPDVVFLDIQMPVKTGFDVVEEIGPEDMPVTVFATAYDEYAIRAFDAAAVDYLLKPFDDDRFDASVKRAKDAARQRKTGSADEQISALLRRIRDEASGGHNTAVDRLLVKDRDTVHFIKTSDIEWIESAGDYVSVRSGGRSHLIRGTMSSMEDRLDGSRFVRIHRSTIVNLDFVKQLKAYFHGDYIVYMKSGQELRLSRRYWHRVQEAMGSESG